jgi:hypothetical protein
VSYAFCGPPGAGKTAAALYLHTKGYTIRSFATELKRVCSLRAQAGWQEALMEWAEAVLVPLYGYHVAYQLYDIMRDKMATCRWVKGAKNRSMLQTVGNAARDIMPDIWVDIAVADLPEKCVFDDCRFVNELAALQARGFTAYRITAPLEIRLARLRARDGTVDEAALANTMEQGLPEVDLPEYANVGALEGLYRWCDLITQAV